MSGPTERFSKVAENYALYRPGYPAEILPLLTEVCHLTSSSRIADIGSGTGLLTRMFLENGNTVYGVEPNLAMRELGEKFLKNFPNFRSVAGSAETTHLPDHTIDFITAGTAFHWFDVTLTRIEFQRILKAGGFVVLIWNVRDKENSPLMQAYENLLYEFSSLQEDSRAKTFEKTVPLDFFKAGTEQVFTLANQQTVDWKGLSGRLLSTSYVLKANDSRYPAMMDALRAIYERYQQNEFVQLRYRTEIVLGQL